MLKEFELFVKKNRLFQKDDQLLLAISGGVDSVALCHLLKEGGYRFALAHCNFKLRGKASDGDENFCRNLADKLKVDFHSTNFDTSGYAGESGLSIQMAARDLRYQWFSELLTKNKYSHLLTAHHAGDNTETVLINLLRGTGINGLKGISVKNNHIVRPLLGFTKGEILAWAKKKKLKYREDASNSEDKYQRNYLRLKVIPKLKQIRPDLDELFRANSLRFSEEAAIINDFVHEKKNLLLKVNGNSASISRSDLEKEKYQSTLLHHFLTPYGFNETQKQNILENIQTKSISGKKYESQNYELHLERKEIVISPLAGVSAEEILIPSFKKLNGFFKVKPLSQIEKPGNNELIIAKKDLKFPLLVRNPKKGDRFKPFGMKGFKLLSDFFREKKFSELDKRKCRLLVNGNDEIIWVIGFRSDERYRIKNENSELIKLQAIERN